jgi:16S rRNA (cytidine1402-2'-O)-methyltransferase
MPGTLYLVATPIGNLADITYRAVETLRAADVIACEDTRQTRKLLEHYDIQRPLVSYHEHNESERSEDLIARLSAGGTVALVSDAGTPLISDPGYRVVRAAVEAGVTVVPIPGASAVLSALSASGLPTDRFTFHGFAPRKSGERQRLFATLLGSESVHVFYESPHRILETLDDLVTALHDPEVVAARELTKVHEEFLRGTAGEVRAKLASRDAIRGEFTLVVGKPGVAPEIAGVATPERVAALEATGLSRMDAIKAVARERGLNKRDVYAQVEAAAKPSPRKR